ncbi:neutral cholesterol ester hydrolase 1-like isoform X1 [Mizuhopecten yessoensis]|uniref:Neutral cholesterol ester hydrolase 1 n=2 Tax=Mizuhopecten yessoensis TaxID=6573 RepID=A0A210PY96_MIZYE|nr:neutral cholesterol ester hydrolase 1-like isoform X1 [Mizuhopecten yessoensis]OWF41419.1 Neutral cholesterol ester hydrolase 1 [Mizuhopecten yessoensis]
MWVGVQDCVDMYQQSFPMKGHASVQLLTRALVEIRLSGASKMAGISRNTYLLWGGILITLAFYLHTPFPNEAAEPWKQRITSASVRIINDLSFLGQLLGIASSVNITRVLSESIKHLNTASLQSDIRQKVQVTDETFDGVPVRVYKPTSTKTLLPGVVHIHGGGWALLSVDAYHAFTIELALKTEAIVVSVEYRLSPEHRFPVPLDDCVTATKYIIQNAKRLGVDSSRVAVMGDSAGGNLAMAVSLRMVAETQLPKLKVQALLYPALQAMDFNTPSYQQYSQKLRKCPSFATKEILVRYWQLYAFGHEGYTSDFYVNNHTTLALKDSKYAEYVNHKHLPSKYLVKDKNPAVWNTENGNTANEIESIITNPFYAPLMASDEELRNLPKTYIMTAEYDCLRDDGWILADRLKSLQLSCKHDHYDGYEHGFALMLHYDVHGKLMNNIVQYFQHNL